jgi:DNA invertase Pin-like site-specific DNA recombinase
MTTCAVYIRKSREEQGKPSHRLQVQREQLPAHARAQGWQVQIYDDGHASAARGKTAELPERARLEGDIRAGRVQIVLCLELSRLSRDDSLQDYTAWLHLCQQHQVKLATPSRILDPGQTSDWMLLIMEGGFSSVEMRILQGRMREGRAEAYRAGKWLSGNPPTPYRHDRAAGGLVIDPEKIATFRRLMQLAETLPAKTVAEQTGLPYISVRNAIADRRLLMYQGLRLDPDTGDTLPGQWPAVIDSHQADRIRAARSNRAKRCAPTGRQSLLSSLGLAVCGPCGASIRQQPGQRRTDGSQLHYYACSASCPGSRMHPQQTIDPRIIKNILGTLARLDDLQHYWQHSQNSTDTTEPLRQITVRETEAQRQQQNLINAIAEGIIPAELARRKSTDLKTQLANLQQERRQIHAQHHPEPDWQNLALSADEWHVLTLPEQRRLLTALLDRIEIYPGRIELTYKFPRHTNGDPTARINLPKRPTPRGRTQVYRLQLPEK